MGEGVTAYKIMFLGLSLQHKQLVDLDTCPLSESGVGMLTIDTGDPLTSPLPLPPSLARTLASFLLTRLLLDLQKSDTWLK